VEALPIHLCPEDRWARGLGGLEEIWVDAAVFASDHCSRTYECWVLTSGAALQMGPYPRGDWEIPVSLLQDSVLTWRWA
jgi:hypothetical protein